MAPAGGTVLAPWGFCCRPSAAQRARPLPWCGSEHRHAGDQAQCDSPADEPPGYETQSQQRQPQKRASSVRARVLGLSASHGIGPRTQADTEATVLRAGSADAAVEETPALLLCGARVVLLPILRRRKRVGVSSTAADRRDFKQRDYGRDSTGDSKRERVVSRR
jgi:hypothetical protein